MIVGDQEGGLSICEVPKKDMGQVDSQLFPTFTITFVLEVSIMALNDVLSDLQADKKEKKTADKKYVSFLKEEWAEMEKTYGKSIEPNDVKKLIQGIFSKQIAVSKVKAPTA